MRARGLGAGEAGEPAHHPQVLLAGQHLVDRGRLAGEADAALDLVAVAHDVEALDGCGARVGGDEGAEDVDDGGLAGSVRSEQGEHGAAFDGEVEFVQHVRLAE